MSPEKEPNFFLDPTPPVQVPSEDAYLGLFAGAGDETWLGEASGRYFSDPTTPGLIKARVPDARIMIALRDPVERAYSSYWHDVKFGIESRPFAEVVDEQLDDSRLPVGADPEKKHVYLGFYSQHVARFLDVFGDAVRVGFLEDLHADPEARRRRSSSSSASTPTWRGRSPRRPQRLRAAAQPPGRAADGLTEGARRRPRRLPRANAHVGREPRAAARPEAAARSCAARTPAGCVRRRPRAARAAARPARSRGSPLLAHSGSEDCAPRERRPERPGALRRCRELRARCRLQADARGCVRPLRSGHAASAREDRNRSRPDRRRAVGPRLQADPRRAGRVLAGQQAGCLHARDERIGADERPGRFRFEGPYPASYEGRPAHIHIRVVAKFHEMLLTRYEPRGARRGTLRLVLRPEQL